ncbi:proline--tRNA ligase [Helcobacillus sp. ACRRO]|uniref:proline--tRNA ligase n=1 Tax=Helcobacillus sp. ACRRO TaxID=2918202 RepID=UPI001EF7383F|nr:proline--tRNA ligase [Helcobacillus sp. ACRRO]MCG7427746.1 proline--tRNA ligase [Helcobacillus sp. ACRRO]
MLRMSTAFLRTLRDNPADAEVASHQLLVRAGYIRRAAPGIYTWLPLGLKVLRKVEQIVREEMDAAGSQELLFPGLLPREPYEATDRWAEYGDNLFRLQDRKGADMLLAPTHEEMFTLAVKDLCSSYKDLPLSLYQIQHKYRDELRPRAGLLRVREFVMKDAYSFDIDDEGLHRSYAQMREAYKRVFERLGLEVVIAKADAGAMGGSQSEEFLHPTEIGEDTLVMSDGGYAANVEAVTTVAPEPLTAEQIAELPAARTARTPGASTIASLVDHLNEAQPREDGRAWEKSDTLKALAYITIDADGAEEPLLVMIPGDREADEKRLEVALAPREFRPFTEDDFTRHPQFAKGYIGPVGFGLDTDAGANGIRVLVDPRVQAGTVWVAGANSADEHTIGLVAGRDFQADGFIEAAEVRDGDQAPDGSGPLRLTRGMEMGHIFELGRKYAEALDLQVLDQNGKQKTVTMGSYGIGVTRAVAAIAEKHHDEKGLAWPRSISPMDVHVLATGKGTEVFEKAEEIVAALEAEGLDVLFDDRPKVSPGVKFKDSELLGIPTSVVIGRSLADGVVEVRDRASGSIDEVSPDEVVARVLQQVREG